MPKTKTVPIEYGPNPHTLLSAIIVREQQGTPAMVQHAVSALIAACALAGVKPSEMATFLDQGVDLTMEFMEANPETFGPKEGRYDA